MTPHDQPQRPRGTSKRKSTSSDSKTSDADVLADGMPGTTRGAKGAVKQKQCA